jgi:hypothetical protein
MRDSSVLTSAPLPRPPIRYLQGGWVWVVLYTKMKKMEKEEKMRV